MLHIPSTTGTVPHSLCSISTLLLLDLSSTDISCAPTCLTTVSTNAMPSTVKETCPAAVDDAFCGLIAATNIASISNYTEWSCTTDGLIATDACASGSEWTGVDCDIVALDLSTIGLRGTLPSAMAKLSWMRTFNLVNNSLTGSLPTPYGNIGALTQLNLGNNILSGQIPSEFGSLTELKEFRLQGNNFTGRYYGEG